MTILETEIDLFLLQGQAVKVEYRKPGASELSLIEGMVIAAQSACILVKPRGNMLADLLEYAQIERVEVIPNVASKVARRELKLIRIHEARQHLGDRHGWTISSLENMTDIEAFEIHENTDHEGLTHCHTDKEKSRIAEKIQEEEVNA